MTERIAVIGGGTIGSSWAAFYALKGFQVSLQDISENCNLQALKRINSMVSFLAEKGLIDAAKKETALSNIETYTEIRTAVQSAHFIQESGPENYEIKKMIYKEIEQGASPEALIGSSTSGLSISIIQSAISTPDRCFTAHPFNPPHLIPLVEIVPGKQTSPHVIDKAKEFYLKLGKVPVILKKEVPGHIANRLAAALWREAIDLVVEGVASVEDVDKAVASGPGLRWALMGPHLIYHMGGGEGGLEHFIEHLGPAFESWWEVMAKWDRIPSEAKETLLEGVAKEVSGSTMQELVDWRDNKLVGLLKLLDYSI